MPDWLALALSFGLSCSPPPGEQELLEAESELGHELSRGLRDLYATTGALRDEWGYALILPVDELVEQNVFLRGDLYRTIYMPFDHVLAFGQLGNGDLFFHPLIDGEVRERVYVWDHEDDSRSSYGEGVEDTVRRWMGGEAV